MSRELSNERCEMEFDDRLSNSTITLYFDPPTTEDRVGYAKEMFVRKGSKIENNTIQVRIKYGLKILTGFKEGDFTKGNNQPLSWDPKSPAFDPAWKTLVRQFAADIVSALAIVVFEASTNAKQSDADDDFETGSEPDGDPAAADKGAEGKNEDPL